MFNTGKTVAMLSLVTLLSACHTPDSNQIAEQATKEIGTPVFIWADSKDNCVTQQLQKLYKQYNRMNHGERETIKKRLSTYEAIIVNATEAAGTITGTVKEIELRRYCDILQTGGCFPDTLARKTLNDTRITENGTLPSTQLQKKSQLILTPQSAIDHSEIQHYWTTDKAAYEQINTWDERTFHQALQNGIIKTEPTKELNTENCGRLAELSDF